MEVSEPAEALIPVEGSDLPMPADDMDEASLGQAIRQSLAYLDRLPAQQTFVYGSRLVTLAQARDTLLAFQRIVAQRLTPEAFARRMAEEFLWFRAAGRDLFGTVLFTGYYLPLLEGRLKPDWEFRYPIYRLPPDVVEIDLGTFRSRLQGERLVGRMDGRKVVPYLTRAEIDGQGRLDEKGLEIAWLKDPVERFFLHIQGSGQILLEQGERLNVNYAAVNGHPYRSIGKILMDEGSIAREEMSMQAIRAFLSAHPERMDEILFANPSYVFFRVVKDGPLGNIEVPITSGRSIATDSRLFPKGGLAFIRAQRPVVQPDGRIAQWRPFSRFVLNQDTGGSIRGAGRVDLYCGSGIEAEVTAGYLQHEGSLYFLIKKP
jgi:membrane-bound lytic murein transglycosylase A